MRWASTSTWSPAAGTWTSPHWPAVPGQRSFRGRQSHTHDYRAKEDFAGRRVVVVGMGVRTAERRELWHDRVDDDPGAPDGGTDRPGDAGD